MFWVNAADDLRSVIAEYILNKRNKLDGLYLFIFFFFFFFVISRVLRNPTCDRSLFIALVYMHHKHVFSTRRSFQITLYATKHFLHVFHVQSYA